MQKQFAAVDEDDNGKLRIERVILMGSVTQFTSVVQDNTWWPHHKPLLLVKSEQCLPGATIYTKGIKKVKQTTVLYTVCYFS